ncbi:zinc-ribbon domain-containing protein [Pseudooceanicola onchidii]|uniref:zinc-ribbon domain-containing protein n=1 Tax=Pseudooceanicola onchidii TaxID=2562279 RepID=UPI0010AADDC8|nr:zinc-ribbon domain-containing protein [Pseudooceanicola onchidii]
MRLTCPNCGAEYEVPDEVIPTSGRDVQCSNCGDTWYQYHPDHMPEEDTDEDDLSSPDLSAARQEPAPDDTPEDDPETFEFTDTAPEDAEDEVEPDEAFDEDFDEDEDDDEDVGPPPDHPAPRRRALDPAVQSILREEAEYEERARGQDPLESQPDLGLGEPEQPPRPATESLRVKPGELIHDDTPAEPVRPGMVEGAAAAASSRRNLLPDIEEINSSLRRKGDTMKTGPRAAQTAARQARRGTQRGFISVLIILAVGATLYLQAPAIGKALPVLGPMMNTYVDVIDRGRSWLDRQAASLAAKLDDMAGDADRQPAPTE